MLINSISNCFEITKLHYILVSSNINHLDVLHLLKIKLLTLFHVISNSNQSFTLSLSVHARRMLKLDNGWLWELQ